jgi:hypothetical protein
MLVAILVITSSAAVSSLIAVDLISWRRTLALRSGRSVPVMAAPSAKLRSSSTTFLAAVAGALAAAAGIAQGARTPSAVMLVAAGLLIAATGLWARVVGLEIDEAGITVRYARRHPYRLNWKDCRGLAPPRWPLGGWCLRTDDRRRTMMPSDVLGNEDVLRRLVQASRLSFDGREWRAVP